MILLEERIRRDGIVKKGDILKVDSFLNHQMDCALFVEMGKEWARLYADCGVNKILTIEASGIGMASVAALEFGCPVVFAKKSLSSNMSGDFWESSVHSYTHNVDRTVLVSKEFLGKGDRVLNIDDFLATGSALLGLVELVRQSGAELVGCGIAIEKVYQEGGSTLRSKGVRVESLARIASMDEEGGIVFC
ncbi:MAG: xanthine phosphoribosyltransferase [Oscillospiraceae bacterium]|nr:xanthine phosphoribosyltransferase [Oscillospiraceae bacterium]